MHRAARQGIKVSETGCLCMQAEVGTESPTQKTWTLVSISQPYHGDVKANVGSLRPVVSKKETHDLHFHVQSPDF